ncbi:MAG: hypothetical protein EXR70_06125 [Deltaproteobacteria bacterium]|nr:hypothetical protein [Deltaproteobacteria bacterium]
MKEIFAAATVGSRKLGRVLFIVHLIISWWIIIGVGTSHRDAQWQLVWICLLPFDFPFSLLVLFAGHLFPDWRIFVGLPSPLNDFHSFIVPMVVHGIIAPLWYLILPVFVDGLMTLRSGRRRAL